MEQGLVEGSGFVHSQNPEGRSDMVSTWEAGVLALEVLVPAQASQVRLVD
jgi:hypothetical protein